MSYTRSGRSVGGRGMTQTHVTYHQVPPRPLGQQFVPQSQQPTYQPQTQPQSQQSLQQQQQQQQPPQQQQQPPAPQPQFKMTQPTPQQQQPTQQPTAQPKVEPTGTQAQPTPAAQPQDPVQAGEGTESVVKPWKKNKNATFKVNKVQKRRRQNARFRKLLIPKNAIMVLNELQPGIIFEAEEQTNAFNQATYIVKLEIDGTVYSGEGPSKGVAKAAAAESAVKGLILRKIAESSVKKESENEDQTMDTGSGDDTSDKGSVNGRRVIPEDEVPWGSLASFALFKLFADWKAQGSSIPPVVSPSFTAPKTAPKPMAPKPPGQPTAKPTMPENPESLHPVTLVGRLHPGNLFTELSREGNPPNMTFTMGVTINGVQYTGIARSKKEAKKLCAINALKALGVPYNSTL